MTTNAIAKMVALGIGGMLVVDALNGLSTALTRVDDLEKWHLLWPLAVPVFLTLCFAILLYRYASKLKFPEDVNPSHSLLWVGLKLLGVYLVISGLPVAVATFGYLAIDSLIEGGTAHPQAAYAGAIGVVEAFLGFTLLFGTRLLVQVLMRGDT